MTAPSKTYTAVADTDIDVGSPLKQELFTRLRDNDVNAQEQLSFGYTPAQAHNHDGVNSALIEIGPNYIRNGSFESSTTGWTLTPFTGGSIATDSSNDLDGATAIAVTSTVLANGGGELISTTFINITGGTLYSYKVAIDAGSANISSKAEVIWYSDAQAQISANNIYTTTATSTTSAQRGRIIRAPAAARYCKVKLTGGIPATGASTGTIYFDGVMMTDGPADVEPGTQYIVAAYEAASSIITTEISTSKTKVIAVPRDGTYTVGFALNKSAAGTSNGRIYINGVATGTTRSNATGSYVDYTEDLALLHGDTCEIWLWLTGGGGGDQALVKDFRLMGLAV